MPLTFVAHPQDQFRLGDFLIESFADPKWTEFRAAIAFIKRSGTKHIQKPLTDFINRGGAAIITAGIDVGGTTSEAIQDLLAALQEKGQLFIFHNANSSTFHPKTYLFKNKDEAKVFVGSTNLTEGGLYTNYEAGFYVVLNLKEKEDIELLARIESALDEWSKPDEGICYPVNAEIIKQLLQENHLPNEAIAKAQRKVVEATKEYSKIASMFKGRGVPSAPKIVAPEPELPPPSEEDEAVLADAEEAETLTVNTPVPVDSQPGQHTIFLMTLQKTDVGVGQTTKGTQRRSPEIFIPLICRDYDPEFWGWPNSFVEDKNWAGPKDKNGRGKMDRTNVMVRLAGDIFPVSIWYNPDKKDVRIRSEHIRSAGVVGDILYFERADGTSGFAYYAEIIPQGTVRYNEYIQLCTQGVRNSKKLWNFL
jgi:HKD family nuclease